MVDISHAHTSAPLISIVIPTLNAQQYLPSALASIDAQIYQHYEIIAIDGGSIDTTTAILEKHPQLRSYRQESSGLPGAWNEGILKARGKYIALLDSDDLWLPHTLAVHMAAFNNNPNLDISLGRVEFFLDSPDKIPLGFKASLLEKNHLGNMPGCFLGKRSIFDQLGLFETHWKVASDLIWFSQMRKSSAVIHELDQVVLKKRVHNANLSYTTAQTPVYTKELLQFLGEKIKKVR